MMWGFDLRSTWFFFLYLQVFSFPCPSCRHWKLWNLHIGEEALPWALCKCSSALFCNRVARVILKYQAYLLDDSDRLRKKRHHVASVFGCQSGSYGCSIQLNWWQELMCSEGKQCWPDVWCEDTNMMYSSRSDNFWYQVRDIREILIHAPAVLTKKKKNGTLWNRKSLSFKPVK